MFSLFWSLFFTPCSMVSNYAWIKNFDYAHICVITDVTFSGMRQIISWWVNTLVYYLFFGTNICNPQLLVHLFVHLLANPFEQTYLRLSLYVYYLLLLISLCFKDCIFTQILQICYTTRCTLWYLEFFFRNFLC